MKKIFIVILFLLSSLVYSFEVTREQIISSGPVTRTRMVQGASWLMAGTRAGEVIIAKTGSKEISKFKAFSSPITALDYSLAANMILVTSLDGSIQSYQLSNNTLIRNFLGHDAPVTHLQILSTGLAVSLDQSNKLILWNPLTGNEVANTNFQGASATEMVEFESFIVIADRKGDLFFYSGKNLELVHHLPAANINPIFSMTITPDERTLTVIRRKGPVELFSTQGPLIKQSGAINFGDDSMTFVAQLKSKRFWLGLNAEEKLSLYDQKDSKILRTIEIGEKSKWSFLDISENLVTLTSDARMQVLNVTDFIQQASNAPDIFQIVDRGDSDELERLLLAGIDPNSRNATHESLLIHLSKANINDQAKRKMTALLLQANANILLTDVFGNQFFAEDTYKKILARNLHQAIIDKNMKLLVKSLDAGADVNALDTFDKTPLRNALESCTSEIITALLASPDLQLNANNLENDLPSSSAICRQKLQQERKLRELGREKLLEGARSGNIDLVSEAVLKNHINIDSKNDFTPLMAALSGNHIQVLRFLIENGALIVDAKNSIHFIREANSQEALELFLAYGENILFNRQYCNGLHVRAMAKDDHELLKLLIEKYQYADSFTSGKDCGADNFLTTIIKHNATRTYRYIINNNFIPSYRMRELKIQSLLYTFKTENLTYFRSLIKETGPLEGALINGRPFPFYFLPGTSQTLINELLEAGVYWGDLDNNGESALTHAAKERNIELFKYYANYISAFDGTNKFAIHYIIDNEDLELFKVYIALHMQHANPSFPLFNMPPIHYAMYKNKYDFYQKAQAWFDSVDHPQDRDDFDEELFDYEQLSNENLSVADAAGLGGNLDLMIFLIRKYKLDIMPQLFPRLTTLPLPVHNYLTAERSRRNSIVKLMKERRPQASVLEMLKQCDLKDFMIFDENNEEIFSSKVALESDYPDVYMQMINYNLLEQEDKLFALEQMVDTIMSNGKWKFLDVIIKDLPRDDNMPMLLDLLNKAAESALVPQSRQLYSILKDNGMIESRLTQKAIQFLPHFLMSQNMLQLIPSTLHKQINWEPYANTLLDNNFLDVCLTLIREHGWSVFGPGFNPFFKIYSSSENLKFYPLFMQQVQEQKISLGTLTDSRFMYSELYYRELPDSYFIDLHSNGVDPMYALSRYNENKNPIKPVHFLKEIENSSTRKAPFLTRLLSTVLSYRQDMPEVRELDLWIQKKSVLQFILSLMYTPIDALDAIIKKGLDTNISYSFIHYYNMSKDNLNPLLYYIRLHSDQPSASTAFPTPRTSSFDADVVTRLISSEINIDQQDSNGWSALMFMAMWDKTNLAEDLLRHGANKQLKDKRKDTATDIAKANGHKKLAKFIKKFKR